MQEELADLDERAASLDVAAPDASRQADELLDDYRALAEKGRSERPGGAGGAEGDLWGAFLDILDLRVEAAETVVAGVESGDLASMQAEIDALNEQNEVFNDRFNQALSHFRSDEPPGD